VISIAGREDHGFCLKKAGTLFDLSLLLSGTHYMPSGLVEVARWGHFSAKDVPWESIRKI
jgi:hypothetical protein